MSYSPLVITTRWGSFRSPASANPQVIVGAAIYRVTMEHMSPEGLRYKGEVFVHWFQSKAALGRAGSRREVTRGWAKWLGSYEIVGLRATAIPRGTTPWREVIQTLEQLADRKAWASATHSKQMLSYEEWVHSMSAEALRRL